MGEKIHICYRSNTLALLRLSFRLNLAYEELHVFYRNRQTLLCITCHLEKLPGESHVFK